MIIPSQNYHAFRTIFATAAAPLDLDGNRPWPLASVRSPSFDGGIRGMTSSTTLAFGVGIAIGVAFRDGFANFNGAGSAVADAVAGVDEYDWWVSQRTIDPAKMYLAVTQYVLNPALTYSGSISLRTTALARADIGIASDVVALTTMQARRLYKNVHVYCRRRSDGAIQWADVYAESLKI